MDRLRKKVIPAMQVGADLMLPPSGYRRPAELKIFKKHQQPVRRLAK
jgi:hypothetical protein